MTLTDLQEILVIICGGLIFLISFTWSLLRIRTYMIRRRRPRVYRTFRNPQPDADQDEEAAPPVDCPWR